MFLSTERFVACYAVLYMFLRAKMARQKTLSSMFSVINKDEMEVCVKWDFAALNE